MGVAFAVAVVGGTIAINLIGITVATVKRDGWHGWHHFINS